MYNMEDCEPILLKRAPADFERGTRPLKHPPSVRTQRVFSKTKFPSPQNLPLSAKFQHDGLHK